MIGTLRPIASAALVLLPLAADSTYVIFFYRSPSPRWFEVLGALTLMACTVAGGYARELQLRRQLGANAMSPPSTV